jgi:hypothetical protein
MMKKVLILAVLSATLLGACSKSEVTQTEKIDTMKDVIQLYSDKGYEVDPSEKPFYTMIGAEDGVIFYIDNEPVKIYKYYSDKKMDQAKKEIVFLSETVNKGLFALETNNEKAKEIFKQMD